MIKILFIHQSAELYGSDKTLLLLLQHLDKSKYLPIVILPSGGPLKNKLEENNIIVKIAPVLKLHRKMFSPKNIFYFIKQIKEGMKTIDKLNDSYHFDFVYSNTLAVLLGIIYASKRKIKHIWHVHEIIESPAIFNKSFRKLLVLKSNSIIIYNSFATEFFWKIKTKPFNKSYTIQNGQDFVDIALSQEKKIEIRREILHSQEDIVIALIGRISRLKGQLTLLEAYKTLANKYHNIKLIFIGSAPPNQEFFVENLKNKIGEYGLQKRVEIIPFCDNIFEIWKSVDIAVVPSIEPESFGLVALEAMLAKKPVVASDHGGLSEIIVNNQTGLLVKPNDSKMLAEALETLILDSKMRDRFGKEGFKRARENFSAEKYVKSFESMFEENVVK